MEITGYQRKKQGESKIIIPSKKQGRLRSNYHEIRSKISHQGQVSYQSISFKA